MNETKDISEGQAKLLREAADILLDGFSWIDSSEGFEYWDRIHRRILRIATTRKIS